jgi:hypothetical protein
LAARAPRSPRLAAPLDPAGQVTAVLALAWLAFGMISRGASGFASPPAPAGLAVGAAAAGCFAVAVRGRPEDRAEHLAGMAGDLSQVEGRRRHPDLAFGSALS